MFHKPVEIDFATKYMSKIEAWIHFYRYERYHWHTSMNIFAWFFCEIRHYSNGLNYFTIYEMLAVKIVRDLDESYTLQYARPEKRRERNIRMIFHFILVCSRFWMEYAFWNNRIKNLWQTIFFAIKSVYGEWSRK